MPDSLTLRTGFPFPGFTRLAFSICCHRLRRNTYCEGGHIWTGCRFPACLHCKPRRFQIAVVSFGPSTGKMINSLWEKAYERTRKCIVSPMLNILLLKLILVMSMFVAYSTFLVGEKQWHGLNNKKQMKTEQKELFTCRYCDGHNRAKTNHFKQLLF